MKYVKVGILGSGFGLYGYLPAFASLGASVSILSHYRDKVAARKELGKYLSNISFMEDEKQIFESCNALVVARRPTDQFKIINTICSYDNIQAVYLEKPIAPNPAQGLIVHDILALSNKAMHIGYIFLYMDLFSLLTESSVSNFSGRLYFTWHFQAHHFIKDLDVWKRKDSWGGGAIRFYGIQLIATLAGFSTIDIVTSTGKQLSPDETYAWRAHFLLGNRIDFYVDINSKASLDVFYFGTKDGRIASQSLSPFVRTADNDDSRVDLLKHLILDPTPSSERHKMYGKILDLWDRIEKCTTFEDA
jgi:hypothetical protein